MSSSDNFVHIKLTVNIMDFCKHEVKLFLLQGVAEDEVVVAVEVAAGTGTEEREGLCVFFN